MGIGLNAATYSDERINNYGLGHLEFSLNYLIATRSMIAGNIIFILREDSVTDMNHNPDISNSRDHECIYWVGVR